MSKTQLLMVMILGVLMSGDSVYAQMHEEHEHKGSMMYEERVESEEEIVKVGNKICPVSGEKVGEMGDVVQAKYNGKLYNLCCQMCKKDFIKNPEKYSSIAEAEGKKDYKDELDEEVQGHHDHDHHK